MNIKHHLLNKYLSPPVRELLHFSGNALLGMILFLPLSFFFLFIVIDAGLALTEKAAIHHALRVGLHSEGLFAKERSPFHYTEGSGIQVNQENLSYLVDQTAKEIETKLETALFLPSFKGKQNIKVIVAVLPLDIDPHTGEVLKVNHEEKTTAISGDKFFDLKTAVPSYPLTSLKEFLNRELIYLKNQGTSPYAIPANFTYEPGNTSVTSLNYLPKSILLYGEITALPRGLNSAYVKSVLGRFFAVQEQEVRMLRGVLF